MNFFLKKKSSRTKILILNLTRGERERVLLREYVPNIKDKHLTVFIIKIVQLGVNFGCLISSFVKENNIWRENRRQTPYSEYNTAEPKWLIAFLRLK